MWAFKASIGLRKDRCLWTEVMQQNIFKDNFKINNLNTFLGIMACYVTTYFNVKQSIQDFKGGRGEGAHLLKH